MDRMVIAGGYGICLFSADTLQDFLKREKIRKRKLLSLLQKDKELYLNTQREGILIPLVGIDHYNYAIKLEGQDEPFDDQWVQKISYEGFNLEVKDGDQVLIETNPTYTTFFVVALGLLFTSTLLRHFSTMPSILVSFLAFAFLIATFFFPQYKLSRINRP